MLTIDFVYDSRLEIIGGEMKEAIADKLIALTQLMQDKVIANVSGKILQKQTGALAASIRQTVDIASEPMVGTVFPDPADDKAWVLEHGGKSYYTIVATKAQMLHFFTKSGQEVFTKFVMHPPSREFAYLRTALEEMAELVPEGFKEAIEAVINR